MENKEELLKKAKELYPKGTCYKSVNTRKLCIVEKELFIYKLPVIIASDDFYITDGGGGTVYDNGLWAEIISEASPQAAPKESAKDAHDIAFVRYMEKEYPSLLQQYYSEYLEQLTDK